MQQKLEEGLDIGLRVVVDLAFAQAQTKRVRVENMAVGHRLLILVSDRVPGMQQYLEAARLCIRLSEEVSSGLAHFSTRGVVLW